MNAFLAIFLPLLIAYETAIRWCIDLWLLPDSYFGHGPLVPLVMAFVIWNRRRVWGLQQAKPDPRAWWLLGPALVLHLCGAALTIDSLSAASLALALPGAAWLALGRDRLRGLWPALWLFALSVPLPLYVTGRLAFELKEIAVRGGLLLANLTGLGVTRSGAALHVPGQERPLDVADPCGGLRSLLAMVTLSYCFAFFLGPLQRRRLLWLLLLAGPIALGVNMVRIASICWLARFQGVDYASGQGHDLMNAMAWVLDMAIVFGLDTLCTRKVAVPLQKRAEPAGPLPGLTMAQLRKPALVLWLLAGPLVLLSETRPYTDSHGRAAKMPETLPNCRMAQVYEFPKDYYNLLGTDDVTWRRYEVAKEDVFVVACFHSSNWKSVHPPHICLQGSNMDLLVDDQIDLNDGTGARVGRILARKREDGRPYLCLYAYVAADLCTGSYAAFFLHHAPRALFRASNAGFLLRVEAYGDGTGGIQGAQERCRALVIQLIAEGRKLLH